MSKFEQCCFYGGYDTYAVSKERYTKQEAIALAIDNLAPWPPSGAEWTLAICDCWVRHRAGVNEDGEPCVGWWMEYSKHRRSCPAWGFHVARHDASHLLERGYERIQIIKGVVQEAGEDADEGC